MGEDCSTWMPQVQFDQQSHNSCPFNAPLDMGKQNGVSNAINSVVNIGTRNVTVPPYPSSAFPHLQFGHSTEPHGWFYCPSRFRQEFTSAPNFTTEEKLPGGHVKGFGEEIRPNGESGFPQKQFLVIDQMFDQTTFIYSSRLGNHVECHASWDSKLYGSNNLNEYEHSLRRDLNHVVGPNFSDKVDENQGTDFGSEMHEDTEEINALLYSDNDDYGYSTEDDEVTSTGQLPSTMTTHDNQEPCSRISKEEVASSDRRSKKRKLSNGAYDDDDIQFMDIAGSQNWNRTFDIGDDDDVESRCSSGNNIQGLDEMSSLSSNKKMKKDKIQDVLSILQSMIPGGKDKDLIELID